jgi:hypothetical protein
MGLVFTKLAYCPETHLLTSFYPFICSIVHPSRRYTLAYCPEAPPVIAFHRDKQQKRIFPFLHWLIKHRASYHDQMLQLIAQGLLMLYHL